MKITGKAMDGWVQNSALSRADYVGMLKFFKSPNYKGYKILKDNYDLLQSFKYDRAQLHNDVETYIVLQEIIDVLQAKVDRIEEILASKKRT